MRPRRFLVPFLGFLLVATAATAQPITIGETITLRSDVLDEERTLLVYLPESYEHSTERYPVLYLLDGETRFHHTTGTAAALARIGQVPEMIVVGITNTDRTRDLTPAWVGEEEPGDNWNENLIAGSGGADNFLRFLRDELIPYVEKTYRTAPFRLLVGHSFGGLFAVHALTSEPDLFDAVLAISPSLHWDGGAPVAKAAALFAERPDLEGRFYVTMADEGGEMMVKYRELEALLRYRAPQGLHWRARLFDGEDHGSVPIPSVHLALKEFYPRWRAPDFVLEEGLEGIEGHFAALGAEYGYEVPVPESVINNLGYVFLLQDKTEEAIAVFRANVERYPASANVYDSLGEGLEAAGQLEEARTLYERAHKMGQEVGDPNTAAYLGHLEAVTEKLAAGP
jgi:predicted alpha/beta superfamily hydrolase